MVKTTVRLTFAGVTSVAATCFGLLPSYGFGYVAFCSVIRQANQ
jgi:hypothetical protein